MGIKKITQILTVAVAIMLSSAAFAENIDPNEDGSQYAYGENVGWLNFEPSIGDGAQVDSDKLTGYVWAENIGWVNLSPSTYGGVFNDGSGNLSGYAWGENVGWINFNPVVSGDPIDYGVKIDSDGNFDGWAYGENIGWIHLASASPVAYKVQACVVTMDDLANFVDDWLVSGAVPGNLDGEADGVDFEDYGIFSGYWQDFCPDGWQLK